MLATTMQHLEPAERVSFCEFGSSRWVSSYEDAIERRSWTVQLN
jgi:hypothetical protein